MNFEVVLGCECKHGAEGGELCYRGKGLVEVDALDLSETLCDQTGFIFLNGSIRALFDMKDPFAPNNFPSF